MSPVQKHFISMRRLNQTMVGQKSIIAEISEKLVGVGVASLRLSFSKTIRRLGSNRAELINRRRPSHVSKSRSKRLPRAYRK